MTLPDQKGTKAAETREMIAKRCNPQGLRLERVNQEEQWLKNSAFFNGKQHFYIEGGQIFDAVATTPEHEVLYKFNICRMSVLRAVAKILNVHPDFRCAPETDSIRDREIAEVSEKVFSHLREKTDFERVLTISSMWAAICGSSFIKVWWDAQSGEPDRFYWDDKRNKRVVPTVMLDDAQRKQKDLDGVFQDLPPGDIALSVISPFGMYHDWTSRDASIKGCQWMIERHYMDINVVADRYGVEPSDLQPDAGSQGLLNYEEAIAFMSSGINSSPFNWTSPVDKQRTRCTHVDMWERPSSEFKKGRRVVLAGGKLLVDGANPNIADKTGMAHIPFIKQDWTHSPGRFWGGSLLEDLTSPQFNMNASRGKLLEFMRVFGCPVTYIGDKSGLDPQNQTIEPGSVQVVSEMSAMKIQHGPMPQLSPEVAGIGNICESDANKIASQFSEESKMPGQMRSGQAIALMSEQRDMALSVTTAEALRVTRDVGRTMISLAQLYYTEKRTMRYLGDQNEFEVRHFTGADLNNDIRIFGTPSVGDTLQSRKAEFMDLVQAGAIQPAMNPTHARMMAKVFKYGTDDEAINTILAAEKNQEYEIEQMIADPLKYGDQGYAVMPWEQHSVEADVCIRFMYSQTFKHLDPRTKSVITDHWQKHDAELKKQRMQEMQMQAMMAGTPAKRGQPSAPAQPQG